MGLLDKVKKFFYEEYTDDEIDEPEEEKEPVKKHHKERIVKVEKEKEKEDISERELFKAERTFNFPIDIGEPEEDTQQEQINVEPEIHEEISVPSYRYNFERRENNAYVGLRTYASTTSSVKTEVKREEKKFKPTPVISPIYGIVDKNKQKEVSKIHVDTDYEIDKKPDYDTIRKKAYGSVYEEDDEEQKGIFFNLNEEKNEEPVEESDVKIIYNDVTFDEEEPVEEEKEKYIPEQEPLDEEVEEEKPNIVEDEEIDDEENITSESNEDDLFNLIDNMYNSNDEEEEDEE